MKWSRNFIIIGYIKEEPEFVISHQKREKVRFKVVQKFAKQKPREFYVQAKNPQIIQGLKRLNKIALVKVVGEIYTCQCKTYLIATNVMIERIMTNKLEAKDGVKNDSNESVAGQGISQVKVD